MKRLALVLAIAACGGGGNARPDALIVLPDAAPDAYTPGHNQVSFSVYGATPQLIAYRDGKGPWLTPDALTAGKYTLNVTDAYEVVVACVTTHDDVHVVYATFGDGAHRYAFCSTGTTTTPTTVAMTGQMLQAGSVFFGDTAMSATAPWSFSLNVEPGKHDLVAIGDDHRMLIRRDQQVTAAATVPTVDVQTDGTAMTQLDLTIHGVQTGDMLMTGIDLGTTNDFASWSSSSATLYAPPASLVTANDFVDIYAETYTPTSFRVGYGPLTATPPTFELPPALTGITFSTAGAALSATWSALPAYTTLELSADDASASFSIEATKAYLDASHTTQLAFDAMPPGFDTSWLVKLAGAHSQMFSAIDDSGPVTYQSGLYQGSSLNSSATAAGSFQTRLRSRDRSRGR